MSCERFIFNWRKWPSRGRGVCRICGKLFGDRRRTICSPECDHLYSSLPESWDQVRRQVFQRDGGICQLCGMDVGKLQRIVDAACRQERRHRGWGGVTDTRRYVARLLGFRPSGTSFWECDHTGPVCEHGPAESLDQLRTLCVPCHKAETAKLRRRLAKPGQKELFSAGGPT